MTRYNVLRVSLDDLQNALMACENCGTQIVLRLGTREQVPEMCPSCRKSFPETLRGGLVKLLEFYIGLGDPRSYAKIEIEVRPESNNEKGKKHE